ncbi:MAG: type IV secretory system conjugative DNA transfer family protein [bacterium]|nr:type IV secretory system conjugative DNA transfer family protein [bacterium]
MEKFFLRSVQIILHGFLKVSWITIQFLFSIIFNFLGGLTIFFFGFSKIRSTNIQILGPGEMLKPNSRFNELFDYSQTATKKEMGGLTATGNVQNGCFWVGKYVGLRGNRASAINDVWISNHFLTQHVLIVGPPGSGKTELLLRSAQSLISSGNLIWIDAAGSMIDRLAPLARQAGAKIGCWDLSCTKNRVVWNFLEELERFGKELEIRAIAEAIYGKVNESDPNAGFWKRDIIWLTALLGVVTEARKIGVPFDPSDLPSLITDRDKMRDLLSNLPNASQQWGTDLYSYFSLPDDRFALDVGFLYSKLSRFKEPDTKAICDGKSTIQLLSALNGKNRHMLVIGQSLKHGEFGSALAGVMLNYIMNIIYKRSANRNHNWNPIYLICDEAPRLKNVDFEEITAIGRQYKASVFLICQSIDQFPEKTLPTLNNCRTQIFLQNVSQKTADFLGKPLGEYQRSVVTSGITKGSQHEGIFSNPFSNSNNRGGSTNQGWERVPVLGMREITGRPYSVLPSDRSALVRVTAASSNLSVTKKVFMTDYST